LRLKAPRKIVFDAKTNNEIRKIINVNSRKVKPGYKKRIKEQIQKVKQKKKREYIESKVKQNLLRKNIEESKKRNI
jgi:ATP-dependent RNA helicase CshB